MDNSIEQMRQHLAFASYAEGTRESYLGTVKQLAAHSGNGECCLGHAAIVFLQAPPRAPSMTEPPRRTARGLFG